MEVPLIRKSSNDRRKQAITCPLSVAVSGWLVAAAIACAYAARAETSTSCPAGSGDRPLKLADEPAAGQAPDSHWLLLGFIRTAGYGQLTLVLSSAAIPFLLDYKKELGEIKKPLLRQMFLVYSGYILVINFCFGLLSAFAAESILTVGFLPSVITGFIFVYWSARFMIALFVFDLSFLNRPHEIVGRVGIELLFTLLPLIYGLSFAYDMGALSLDFAVPDLGPFGRMLVIIVILFMIMKACVFMMPKSGSSQLNWFQTFLFFFVWPGMRPSSFHERKGGLDWWTDACWGTLFIVLGFLWSFGVKCSVDAGLSPSTAGLLALPAVSMMGHVGGMRILRGALRMVGYDVEQLFVDPLLATSMADFWGKRWNVAFSDMNRFVFVAAVRTALEEDLGVSRAKAGQVGVFTAFVASALLHECGITAPVLSGFGGPSLYFLIQGVCVLLEKRPAITKFREKHTIAARLFMWIAIAAPFPICFVVPFRTEIALPLVMMVAGLPKHVIGLLV